MECMFKKPQKSDMISCVKKKNGETNLITIYCALYAEAQYLIQYYELKKASVSRHFQVFENDKKQVRLVITGVGKMNAAVAVAEISTIDPPAKDDLMVNYGSCAAEPMLRPGTKSDGGAALPVGSLIMVNKLIDVESGRTFYPDMIYRHPFLEGEVETSVHVYAAKTGVRDEVTVRTDVAGVNAQDEEMKRGEAVGQSVCDESMTQVEGARQSVHDMEAAAFYEAGNFFYGPHQMMFLKVVTDYGMPANVTKQKETQVQDVCGGYILTESKRDAENSGIDKERFAQIMQTAGAQVVDFLDGVLVMMQQDEDGTTLIGTETLRENKRKQEMQGDAQDRAERLAEDLHCSVTMRAELMQLLTYWRLAGFDAQSVIDVYYEQGLLPCKDKRTGRRLLDELQNKWL